MTLKRIFIVLGATMTGLFGGAQGGASLGEAFGSQYKTIGTFIGAGVMAITACLGTIGAFMNDRNEVQNVRIVQQRDPLYPFRRHSTRAERRRHR